MRIVTANRLSDGRVIYVDAAGEPTSTLAETAVLDETEAEAALARAAARPEVFVNPYLVEVDAQAFIGRDRLKEAIRSAGPTVGHSSASPQGFER